MTERHRAIWGPLEWNHASKQTNEWVSDKLALILSVVPEAAGDSTRSSYIWQLSVGKHAQIQLDILTSPLHELSQLNATETSGLISL